MRHLGEKKRISIRLMGFFLLLAGLISLSACQAKQAGEQDISRDFRGAKPKLVLADGSWDSIQIHNRIAAFIIKNGYGYPVEFLAGETLPTWQALSQGDLDIIMEVWTVNNQAAWDELMTGKSVRSLGANYANSEQGWYVPTYMIEGDVERGIEPIAPNLRSIYDLNSYWKLFQDPDSPGQGRIINSPTGWDSSSINLHKFASYRLDKNFDLIPTSSYQALRKSLADAYEKGRPWLGYAWKPGLTAQQKLTRLRENPYYENGWKNGYACAYPEAEVIIAAYDGLADKAPEVLDFLSKYETSLEQNENMIAYMNDNQGNKERAAVYFLQQYPDVWKEWVPEPVAVRVEKALGSEEKK